MLYTDEKQGKTFVISSENKEDYICASGKEIKVGIGKDKKDRNAKQAEYSLSKENPGARNLYTVT